MKTSCRYKSYVLLLGLGGILVPGGLVAFEARLPRYYFHNDKLIGTVEAKGTLLCIKEVKGTALLPQEQINTYSLSCTRDKRSCLILRYLLREDGTLTSPEQQKNYLIVQQWSDSLILAKEEWHEGACYLLTIRFEPLLEAVKFIYDRTNNKNNNCGDSPTSYNQKLIFNLSEPPLK